MPMDYNEENVVVHKLEVPRYVSLQREIVKGLSLKHFGISLLLTIIALVLMLIINSFFPVSAFWGIIIMAVIFFFTSGLLTKSPSTHMNIFDLIKVKTRFANQQKNYLFIFERKENRNVPKKKR